MTGRLRGKVAIVAGAGSIGPGWGNGKATATVFAREGAKVVCADVNLNAAEETAAIIENEGGEAFAVRTDVTRAEQVADLVDRTLGRYGRIDILDNNVGIAEVGSVVDLSEETWEKVFRVNLTGAFLAMKHVIPVMQRQFEETGEGVERLAALPDGRVVAVRQGSLLGTSFHPEVTGEHRFHALFLDMVRNRVR